MKKTIFILLMMVSHIFLFSQTTEEQTIFLDFRNQRISDILLALAEIANKTIIIDETVSGSATFRFADADFESALTRFADHSNLFITKQGESYYISKVSITVSPDTQEITIEAEETAPELIIKKLAKEAKKTIVYDALPAERLTIRTQNASLEEILRLILMKNPEYTIVNQSGGFYVKRDAALMNESRAAGNVRITERDGLYSVSSQRVVFNILIDTLFKQAGKEYLLLNRSTAAVENIYYENKDFASLLRLILDTVNYDYTIQNDVYYLFEIQKRDVVKKLKETVTVTFTYLSVVDVQNILPAELNATNFIRIDRVTNSIFVTGSEEEINPILSFLRSIDVPLEGRYYKQFSVHTIDVSNAVSLLPKSFFYTDPVIIPNTPSFVAQVDAANEAKITEYLVIIDKKNLSYPIRLRYIKSDELMQYLPPSAVRESINVTGDTSLVFYTGTEDTYNNVMKEIMLIDQPKPQIRYQLLVIQRQRSDSLHWDTDFSMTKTDAAPSADYSADLSNLLNINFDIVSTFGIQFAANLNAELGQDRAKVLADTTLNAISEEEITFENTMTYRYRDVVIDPETHLYSGTTREITSGLTLKIKGWVSGDEMITVNVNANVSKQGAVSTSGNDLEVPPPSTSEKMVNTHVRAKSGAPIIIGGLLQSESDVVEKKVPFLGEIPLLGLLFRSEQITVTETEFIIYLIPFVEKPPATIVDMEKNINTYYSKYISGEIIY